GRMSAGRSWKRSSGKAANIAVSRRLHWPTSCGCHAGECNSGVFAVIVLLLIFAALIVLCLLAVAAFIPIGVFSVLFALNLGAWSAWMSHRASQKRLSPGAGLELSVLLVSLVGSVLLSLWVFGVAISWLFH